MRRKNSCHCERKCNKCGNNFIFDSSKKSTTAWNLKWFQHIVTTGITQHYYRYNKWYNRLKYFFPNLPSEISHQVKTEKKIVRGLVVSSWTASRERNESAIKCYFCGNNRHHLSFIQIFWMNFFNLIYKIKISLPIFYSFSYMQDCKLADPWFESRKMFLLMEKHFEFRLKINKRNFWLIR